MTPKKIMTEKTFETLIQQSLINYGGYRNGNTEHFNKEYALDTHTFLSFIKNSQPLQWQQLQKNHGSEAESRLVKRLADELDNRGTLDVLRKGITDYGVRFKTAWFKPVSGLNPDHQTLYDKNILTVTRQLFYSSKTNHSLDMLLSLNGLPIATAELKNPSTGQTADDAKTQYKNHRDPREPLFQFKKRTLVHFAVDPDRVFMTTRLQKKQTEFLPFNKGYNNGAGNPPNPGGHASAYLWENIWPKDNWMDIIGNFISLQKDKKKKKPPQIIFPRYHQLDVVRQLAEDARKKGPGNNYLVQHSAGSGKSNSIAWLAYRLARLHNSKNQRVFDSVIVVTDRIILDRQLQDTISQFDYTDGVLHTIDKRSKQLAKALEQGANIIVTTLQKFPFVLDKIGKLPDRNYALIVDEAHSSQGGESAKAVKDVLSVYNLSSRAIVGYDHHGDYDAKPEADGDDYDPDDYIRINMLKRGRQPNLSFFAFTATPKAKTLEAFGEENSRGQYEPHHLYSMRQAIEEKFIKDVLENYTSYKTFFRLTKAIMDDPRFDKKKANSAISRFVSLHPHNIAQKTQVMVEHFRQYVMHKIGGRAKAMVVTSSRPQLIRYKEEFDRYIKEKNYNIETLAAFTAFTDPATGFSHSELEINGFKEKELPAKFDTDQYRILLVAEKYQTGFDQPLLHTMYVDKKLSGVKAVQTLSRLNRIYAGKDNPIVLDFANDEESIYNSFKDYYERTGLLEGTDPNKLYDYQYKLDSFEVTRREEIEGFVSIYFKPSKKMTASDHGRLEALIRSAVDRYEHLEEDEQDEFKHTLTLFVRLYAFLAQIMPFSDMELEKYYAYTRFLQPRLVTLPGDTRLTLDDEVELEYYRLQRISENSIRLPKNEDGMLTPVMHAGTKKDEEVLEPLSEIIKILNERFGTDFGETERYYFAQLADALLSDEDLFHQAKNNTVENFKYGVNDRFFTVAIELKDKNLKMFKRLMDDKEFARGVIDALSDVVYNRFRTDGQDKTI